MLAQVDFAANGLEEQALFAIEKSSLLNRQFKPARTIVPEGRALTANELSTKYRLLPKS